MLFFIKHPFECQILALFLLKINPKWQQNDFLFLLLLIYYQYRPLYCGHCNNSEVIYSDIWTGHFYTCFRSLQSHVRKTKPSKSKKEVIWTYTETSGVFFIWACTAFHWLYKFSTIVKLRLNLTLRNHSLFGKTRCLKYFSKKVKNLK